MSSQSSLGETFTTSTMPGGGRSYLRTGRISSPVSQLDDPQGFDAYVTRCLREWAVDILLDSGEYLQRCRVVSPQANGREGLRRMFRFPTATDSGVVTYGDMVLIGFVNGLANSPVVLGALTPLANATAPDSVIEDARVNTQDPAEWQDRHDYVDLTEPGEPLPSSTMTRDTGLTHEHEHQTQTRVNGSVRNAHILERDLAARSTEYEQLVEGDGGVVGIIRDGNTEALDRQYTHVVQEPDSTSSLTIEDLHAQVLQLTHQVGTLAKLVLRSDQVSQLSAQQQTSAFRLTLVSDADSKTTTLLHEDLDAQSQGGVTLSPNSQVVLRRASQGQPESFVQLNEDGTITLKTSSGTTVHLDTDDILLTSKTTTVMVSEQNGVSVTTAQGSMVSVTDDAMVVSAPAVSLRSPAVHLDSGLIRAGTTGSAGSGVPAIETLYQKLLNVEEWMTELVTWADTHTHGSAQGPTTPPVSPATEPPTGQFNPTTAQGDALQTFRGD